jgi:lysophospholipase L1-like esterase
MDVYKAFADDNGLLRKDYSRDGLHLNDTGYHTWAKLVEKALSSGDPIRPTASRPDPGR